VPSDFLLVLFMQERGQFVQAARSDADNCLAAALTDPNAQMHE